VVTHGSAQKSGWAKQWFFGGIALFLAISGQSVTLEWDRNPEPNVAGYRVYSGRQSRVYGSVLDVGNQTVAQLPTNPGTTFYAVTAYDDTGLESDFSEEVSYTPPAQNQAPVAAADTFSIGHNQSLSVPAPGVLSNDTDADGNLLTTVLMTGVSSGTLTLNNNGSFVFQPASGFSGTASFTYAASDGQRTSAVVTVTIQVAAAPVNRVPNAVADAYAVAHNQILQVAAAGVLGNDSDADGDVLQAMLVASVTRGMLALNANGSFSYTPNSGYSGSDSFSYVASDGKSTSAVATVTLSVAAAPNRVPVAVSNAYSVAHNQTLNVSAANGVLNNDTDADGDSLRAWIVNSTTRGALVLNTNGSFSYTPNTGVSGTDSFTYVASDGKSTSSAAIVTLTIAAPPATNRPPSASGDAYQVAYNQTLSVAAPGVLANDSDADGDALRVFLASSPTKGSVSLATNGSFVFTPQAGATGGDSFTYFTTDGRSTSSVAVVSLNINPAPNQVPVARPDSYATPHNQALNMSASAGLLANDSDGDGDTLRVVLVSGVNTGTLNVASNGSFQFAPASGFAGSVSFSYAATDGRATSAPVSVTINVAPAGSSSSTNRAPIAAADTYRGMSNEWLVIPAAAGVLTNDWDADGDVLSVSLVATVTHGTLVLNTNGSFTYAPEAGFAGTDSFAYVVYDGRTSSVPATVWIQVEAPAPPPTEVSCWSCLEPLEPLLIARGKNLELFRSKTRVPTNSTCLQSNVAIYGTLVRDLEKTADQPLKAALLDAGECMASSMRSEITQRSGKAALLAPSRYLSSAYSHLGAASAHLDIVEASTTAALRSKRLVSAWACFPKVDRMLKSGDLAPVALDGRSYTGSVILVRESVRGEWRFDGNTFHIADVNGATVAAGTYTYDRSAWNRGSLVVKFNQSFLGYRPGRSVLIEMHFTTKGCRLIGGFTGTGRLN
jgi:hypothetical protein